ncbi:MAG TPA: LysR family transcriptional regulator [Xanthobacteraceae bacterium]|nr:LysR family transcriptional regulator [Xanthobacteraceae bacterium]
MGEKLDCEHEIGRRLRLRDLHVFLTVSQRGSMAQAAAQLGVSQPAVSGVIADLERTLGVPLFERSTRGVKPTVYARAMMDRSVAAFDELKQGLRTLETLADPTAGELWIGCIESISALILPPILQQFMQRYPRVVVHVARLSTSTAEIRELCERNLDLVLGPLGQESARDGELVSEPLLETHPVVAAGVRSRWADRRHIDLGDLAEEPWVLTPRECRLHTALNEAFRARGLAPPLVSLMTFSIPLRMSLAASGPYLTVFPSSIRSLSGYRRSIKILPIDLPASAKPVSIITLKSRKLNPVAQRFIEHLRAYVSAERL